MVLPVIQVITLDGGRKPTKLGSFEYWPAQSPDLNPIEHVWNALERRIERKRSSIKNLEQLKVALREEWERMDDEFADRLVRSMKRRCEAVIKAKGGVLRIHKIIVTLF
ncbi:hypothetical protein G6F46_013729 [Rhizopus delemar]|uniref:Tc1-like transposase DDE domain-containing protein n=2 Tax=Rhizopus TaxID=4842 RepID=A0A9P6XU11_9FUNG|nr:hypothetical protein G6F55_013384 [Rhizopus delemar]KAG1530546.1 hypothetical protein G6F51_013808 [Rhizopus arrhizus]KAG1481186.1 hypothetical protein G6F54_013750 [Rhizopus delemar]KAG1488906.1 hypothetical protein G6F53_013507 [Rhizopus delemar]KAG1490584.1 hypothetical protein G6F52_013590 [Rhizopus delemar]